MKNLLLGLILSIFLIGFASSLEINNTEVTITQSLLSQYGYVTFDGSTGCITTDSNLTSAVNQSSSLSILFWINGNGSTNSHSILRGGGSGANSYYVYLRADNKIGYGLYTNGTGSNESSIGVSNTTNMDAWRMYGLTWNGTTVIMYENGTTNSSQNAIKQGSLILGSSATQIGCRPGLTHNFNGSIDELMIYNRSLNATEVLDYYNRGRTINETIWNSTGLIAYYSLFNESEFTGRYSSSITATGINFTKIYPLKAIINFTTPSLFLASYSVANAWAYFANLRVNDADVESISLNVSAINTTVNATNLPRITTSSTSSKTITSLVGFNITSTASVSVQICPMSGTYQGVAVSSSSCANNIATFELIIPNGTSTLLLNNINDQGLTNYCLAGINQYGSFGSAFATVLIIVGAIMVLGVIVIMILVFNRRKVDISSIDTDFERIGAIVGGLFVLFFIIFGFIFAIVTIC